MTAIENNTNVIELGREAARRWGLASSHGDAGDATAIVAMVHAQRVIEFEATVERKKEDTVETLTFNVTDLATPLYNNDGSKDTRAMSARTACLADRLFGITDLNNAIKTRIARCLKIAVYLIGATKDMTDEELFDAIKLNGSKLVAPYGLVKPTPAEDASDNDKTIFEAMREKPLTLDGKDGASLAELSRRANPPKASRAASNDKSEGASFTASVDFVTAIVSQQLNENADESEVGLSNEARRKLFSLAQSIAAYFAADPLEDEEQAPVSEAA